MAGCTGDDDNAVFDIDKGYYLLAITFGSGAVATISTSFSGHESSAF